MKNLLLILIAVILTGCNSLNFQNRPKIQPDCQYDSLANIEFKFESLPNEQLAKGFVNVYVAQSKNSATLSADYQGIKGKLTGYLIERYYPQDFGGSRHISLFREPLLFDDYNDYFYLSPKQREERILRNKSIFQQAILQNCEIVYILIDSLNTTPDNPLLIEKARLKIINK